MQFKPALIAAALVAASMGASATVYNIGVLPLAPAVYSNTVNVPAGAFSDTYNFSFPLTGDKASASAVSIQLNGLLDISNLKVDLYDASNNWIAGGAVGNSSAVSNVPLMGGANYYYTVTGTATGAVGGAYAFIASASPIPEPGTYGLMLAGLGAVGFLAARRRQA
ncbi:MAG: PEP-CTERM sorting domain-containing protein [Burkholderiales bacterium]|uniref:FxDxF family PEP-CTERM protein n=1 Tax=Inhella sp. TaxID=1921806 RepID=UPI001AC9E11A|nr:PEP-CTERM sorting domain-containing protein [Burkholderiales bacterium]